MSVIEEPIHLLSVEDVQQMYDTGILTGEDRVELLDGVLVDVPHPSPAHSAIVSFLNRTLVMATADLPYEVRVQDTLIVAGGFLNPDLIVVDTVPRGELPDTAQLAIEVSHTTLRRDIAKAARYARAGVHQYWIVDVSARTLIVHREPIGEAYRSVTRHAPGETVTPPVGSISIPVADLLS